MGERCLPRTRCLGDDTPAMQEALGSGTPCSCCFSLKAPPPALTAMLFADTEGGHSGTSSPRSRVLPPLGLFSAGHCPPGSVGSHLRGPRRWQSVLQRGRGAGDGLCWGRPGTPPSGTSPSSPERSPETQTQSAVHRGRGWTVSLWGLGGRGWPRPHSSHRPGTRLASAKGHALPRLPVLRRRGDSRGGAPFIAEPGARAGWVGVRGGGGGRDLGEQPTLGTGSL